MSATELARVIKLDRLPSDPIVIEASPQECAALARRFDLSAVHALEAEVTLMQQGPSIEARGRLTASFDQSCSIAGEAFTNRMDEPLAIRFVPSLAAHGEDEEIEFAGEEADEVEYDGAAFDLGEAIAQSFGLALDPYATGPDAGDVRRDAGILGEDAPSGPFAALAALKPKS